MGGIDVGGSAYSLGKRLTDKAKLEKYVKEDKKAGETAMETYVYGDSTQENTAMRLANKKDKLLFSDGEGEGWKAETRQIGHTALAAKMMADGQKLCYSENLASDISNYLKGKDAFNSYVDDNYDSSKDYFQTPATTFSPNFQQGAPYAYTSKSLMQFYEDAARRGDQVEF